MKISRKTDFFLTLTEHWNKFAEISYSDGNSSSFQLYSHASNRSGQHDNQEARFLYNHKIHHVHCSLIKANSDQKIDHSWTKALFKNIMN